MSYKSFCTSVLYIIVTGIVLFFPLFYWIFIMNAYEQYHAFGELCEGISVNGKIYINIEDVDEENREYYQHLVDENKEQNEEHRCHNNRKSFISYKITRAAAEIKQCPGLVRDCSFWEWNNCLETMDGPCFYSGNNNVTLPQEELIDLQSWRLLSEFYLWDIPSEGNRPYSIKVFWDHRRQYRGYVPEEGSKHRLVLLAFANIFIDTIYNSCITNVLRRMSDIVL